MLSSFLYSLCRCYLCLIRKLRRRFWQWYQVQFLRHTSGVKLSDHRKLFFKDKCVFKIENGAYVCLGQNVYINSGGETSFPTPSKIAVAPGASLTIGDNSGISTTSIICKSSVSIGDNVNVGAGTLILDSNMHSLDWRVRMHREKDCSIDSKKAPVVIEDNAFIGARCIITKGVTIGRNAIVAAGSVVVKSIPANAIAGGNPCKIIKVIES